MTEQPQLSGTEFNANGRVMKLVEHPGSEYDGWILYRHPDGQWVTLRKATKADYETLANECHRLEMWHYEQGGFYESAHLHQKAERFRALAS